MFFVQYDTKPYIIPVDKVTAALVAAGLIPKDAAMSGVSTQCYCEDGEYCNCLPETLEYYTYTIKPNHCPVCNARDAQPCKTRSGRTTSYHKKRRAI